MLALARLHPQSRIIVVTQHSKGALAEAALRIESADVEQGWHGVFGAANAPLPERATNLLDGAHAVYSFLANSGDAIRARVSAETQVISLGTIPPDGWAKHASDWLVEQLAAHPALRSAVEQM